jgi:hypothetical protein
MPTATAGKQGLPLYSAGMVSDIKRREGAAMGESPFNNVKYVVSAPETLVNAHKNREIAKGVKYLELLLTHREMELAWTELSKHTEKEDHATRLFSEIVLILHTLRRHIVLRRTEEKKKYLATAEQAEKLASSIENGPLDKLAFEYFPTEVMHINGIDGWETENSLERSAHAHELLQTWPSFVEMLLEMASQAKKLASEAMTKHRIVERRRGEDEYRQLYFVRALTEYVVKEYGSPLYGTVAHISNAILKTGFSKEEVGKMVKGSV